MELSATVKQVTKIKPVKDRRAARRHFLTSLFVLNKVTRIRVELARSLTRV
jgi:hypothetical protein